MQSQMEKSILSAIVYFDIFDYPLTLIEINRFLLDLSGAEKRKFGLDEVRDAFERSSFLQNNIRFRDGYFYLRGRDKILSLRHDRYAIAEKKFERARLVLRLLARLPFVRALFLCNSLSYNNTKDSSDIDLVVVAKRKRVWLARSFCLLLLSFLHRRPGQGKGADQICLSVFADEDHLDFSDLRMGERDIDFTYWIACFYPVYDPNGLYGRFWSRNFGWISNNLPASYGIISHPSRRISGRARIRCLLEFVLRPLEHFAGILQRAKFPSQIRELMNRDTRVMVREGLLKFHVNDRRLEHLEKFVKLYEKVTSS